MSKMIPAEAAKAKPSALPRKGAVQGVASTVAMRVNSIMA